MKCSNYDKYEQNLPSFVKGGFFCLTLAGQKAPYDPFLKEVIGADKNFYNYDTIIKFLDPENKNFKGANLGLKIGSNNISAIDIDGCVDPKTGVIETRVIEMLEKSELDFSNIYVEYSPSKTGLRLLFKTKTPFDTVLYYTKNSKINLEYYDAITCSQVGKSRMVRISGEPCPHPLFKMHELKKYSHVDTSILLKEYMERSFKAFGGDIGVKVDISKVEPINEPKTSVIAYLTAVLPFFFNHNNRLVKNKSESEWDLFMLVGIGSFTKKYTEIMDVFKKTKYYLKKDYPHLKKWERPFYISSTFSQVNILLQNSALDPSLVELEKIISAFDNKNKNGDLIIDSLIEKSEISAKALTEILEIIGIIKVGTKTTIVNSLEDLMIALYYASTMRITTGNWTTIKKQHNLI